MAREPDEYGRYTDKDMTIIIDGKSNHDWIVPRRVMCAFFWIGIILLFTGIILLVTSKHKGEVYQSWGAILLGLGFCLLLICLILCLHAYCVITITEDEPLNKRCCVIFCLMQRNIPPPPPSVVMNGRKPRNKGEGAPERDKNKPHHECNSIPTNKRAKPIQLLIVDKDDMDEVDKGGKVYFSDKDDMYRDRERGRGVGSSEEPSNPETPQQTSKVTDPRLGDVHVSVRPANPVFGSPSNQTYDIESTEAPPAPPKIIVGPVPPDIPLHLLESMSSVDKIDEELGAVGGEEEKIIIPTQYSRAFSVVKGNDSQGNSSQSQVENTYIGYQEGMNLHPYPIGQIVTTKPPPIPGRHSSQVTAHVIPIPYHGQYKNYPVGILPPPPPKTNIAKAMHAHQMAIKEQAIKFQLVPGGDHIDLSKLHPHMPENYIQRIPPEHDHEGRRFSQPVVVYLNPNQNLGLSQLSMYDNVQYVWTENPPGSLPPTQQDPKQ